MARIFLCYASEDRAQVHQVYDRLRVIDGFEPWLDVQNLLPGQNWEREILRALQAADFILIFLSRKSMAKRGYIQREMKLALDIWEEHPEGSIHTIPVRLDDCDVPERFRRYHWANLFDPHGFEHIVRSIRAALAGRSEWMDEPREAGWHIEEARRTAARTLNLAGLGLSSLPESIGQLSQLQQLDLSKNRLSSLPESIRQLSQLQQLYLHDNSGLRIPLEILGPTWEQVDMGSIPAAPYDILTYYFQSQQQPRRLNEAKLILVGNGAVGKTSLINRLVHDNFNPGETKTEGINITEWPLRLSRDEDVQLNIWDFGGQEIMHATHQFFLTQRSLYALVLNGRQGHEDGDAEYWLQLVESFGEDSPVIIVLNKIKEHSFDLNRRALQQKFPSIRGFVQTDCADKTGIDELRQMIERETDRLEHLRDTFPASWFTIKNQLLDMQKTLKKDYVTFDEYRAVCATHGEADFEAQERLAFYLHTLGIALNYRDDRRLQDTHVLNPRWVTNGIYKLLNAEQLAVQRGEVRLVDLPGILDQNVYPQRMHGFLLDLMRKFELCFTFPDEDGRFLVPELLDKQQPEEAEAFDIVQCLNFEYHYPILPEGLLPRFIVRTHVLSAEQRRWKSGVILEFEDNRALVKADAQAKIVMIHVSGLLSGRRRLLGIIRSDFEHIHRSFRFEAKEMVPVPGHRTAIVPYKHLLLLEKNGRETYTVPIDNEILDVSVQELLDGVDLKDSRKTVSTIEHEDVSDELQLFYSYSHKDERLRDELETHLKLLQRQGLIASWHDRRIMAGDAWDRQIDQNLERADIILLLISSDFIASDYCYDIEMQRALERHALGDARVVPIIVRDVNWRSAPFAKLHVLPTDGRAVMKWQNNRDSAWRSVAEGIEHIINDLRTQREGRRRG